jgi:hypothetical protein
MRIFIQPLQEPYGIPGSQREKPVKGIREVNDDDSIGNTGPCQK